jgi:chromosome partitioning protein
MHTVAILSQKGGTGKTTLTLHLAVAAERAGSAAAVIDLDPQASAAGWKDSRTGETPVVVSVPASRLPQAIEAAREGGAALSLIDTAPHASDAALAAAEASDLVLIPCRAGILDLRAIGTTARAIKLAGTPAFVVLNAMPPRAPNVLADARDAVAVHGLDVAPFTVQQRAAYAHALTGGQTAQEYEPQGKAAEEMAQLYSWLCQQLAATIAKLPAIRQEGNLAIRQPARRWQYEQKTQLGGIDAASGSSLRSRSTAACVANHPHSAAVAESPRTGLLCCDPRWQKEGDGDLGPG